MSSPPPPRVLLVSTPLQGHVNPLLVLRRRLTFRGLPVTFSTVPYAGLKFSYRDGEAINVRRGALCFEHLHGGGSLRPHDNYLYRVTTFHLFFHRATGGEILRRLEDAAPAALAELIRLHSGAGRAVACVVANVFIPWAGRVAGAVGVPHAVLWTESCAILSLFYHYFHSLADSRRTTLVADLRSLRETVSWVLVNTFDELEHPAVEALRAHLPITPVGPLFEPEDYGGHEDDGCVPWLDAQPPGSVVFVAFGSMMKLSRDEMAELAAGLAATGRPFLLVVRDNNRELLPDDCVAAATGGDSRGKVVAWCDQGRVLSHRAVGCFVMHCGRNSTTEALASGVPVVAYPGVADQPTNAMFLVDVYGVGVRLPRPMARDALRCCVEEVLSGPEAAAMRARAGEWKAEASAAQATGGSSDKGVRGFVDAVLSLDGAGDG
uniref:Glycosyltransferase n=1 Tax=Setaria viridis TaxID=4556 RepID=A0A4V6D683_SETVI|nr:hypothetical protein SEVIR_5G096800v2 [Setaria viridis]